MRYIVNANNYITTISFGCYIECQDDGCTEYKGSVPAGYDSLEDWYATEVEKLYRWKIVNGQLTLDSSAVAPEKDYDHLADKNNPHGVTIAQIGAAPSGYGYGGSAILVRHGDILTTEAELDAELATIYDAMESGETKMLTYQGWPSPSDWRWFCILTRSSVNNGSMIATSAYSGGTNILKTKYNGSWLPAEWECPPMLLGVEYRTTERWRGAAVYARAVNVGYVSAGNRSFAHNCAMSQPISADVYNNSCELLTGYSGITNLTVSRTHVHMSCSNDFGDITFYLKYTK